MAALPTSSLYARRVDGETPFLCAAFLCQRVPQELQQPSRTPRALPLAYAARTRHAPHSAKATARRTFPCAFQTTRLTWRVVLEGVLRRRELVSYHGRVLSHRVLQCGGHRHRRYSPLPESLLS